MIYKNALRILGFSVMIAPVLAGCMPSGNSPDAVCERVMYNDPTVREMRMKQAGSPWLLSNDQAKLRLAEKDVKDRCLRLHGVMGPQGGVASPKPRPGDYVPSP